MKQKRKRGPSLRGWLHWVFPKWQMINLPKRGFKYMGLQLLEDRKEYGNDVFYCGVALFFIVLWVGLNVLTIPLNIVLNHLSLGIVIVLWAFLVTPLLSLFLISYSYYSVIVGGTKNKEEEDPNNLFTRVEGLDGDYISTKVVDRP